MKNTKLQPGILALIGSVTIWGSTFVITKALFDTIGPFTVIGIRLVISLLVLIPLAMRRGFHWNMIIQKKYLLYGLTGVALFFGLSYVGLDRSTAGNAALIQAANPAAIALFSFLILKEKISVQRASGIMVSIIGVLLVSGSPSEKGNSTIVGNLLLIGGVIAWAMYTVQGKKLPKTIDTMTTTTVSFITGLLWLVPFILWELSQTGLPEIGLNSWVALIYLGLVASALAFFLWNFGLETVEASLAAPFINLIPIIGLLFSLFVGETISTIQILGGLIAIIGVLITQNIHPFSKGALHENPDSTH